MLTNYNSTWDRFLRLTLHQPCLGSEQSTEVTNSEIPVTHRHIIVWILAWAKHQVNISDWPSSKSLNLGRANWFLISWNRRKLGLLTSKALSYITQSRVSGARTRTGNNPKENGKAVRAPGNVTRRRGTITKLWSNTTCHWPGETDTGLPASGRNGGWVRSYSG